MIYVSMGVWLIGMNTVHTNELKLDVLIICNLFHFQQDMRPPTQEVLQIL